MDRLDAMALCLEVSRAGSLSAAGRNLHMPLATVSRKIADLERHLGTRLFTRSTRRLDLTDAGRDYAAACRRVLEQVAEAERAAAGEYSTPRGELAVTAPVVLGRLHVLPLAVDFLAAYPEITLRLGLSDRALDLIDDHVDLAVRIGPLPDSDLIATRVGAVRQVVCASPDYLRRKGIPGKPGDISDHDCVAFDSMAPGGAWRFRRDRREEPIPVPARLSVNSAEAAIEAAVAGLGLTRVLSYQVADAARLGKLEIVLETFEPEPWPVHLVHVRHGLMPQKLRVFADWLGPRLKARLLG